MNRASSRARPRAPLPFVRRRHPLLATLARWFPLRGWSRPPLHPAGPALAHARRSHRRAS